MTSYGSDYATAREYLTEEASLRWQPSESQVLIYASGTTPRVTGNQVTMSGAVIGYLRSDYSFLGSPDPTWNHDFGMVKEDGEWRISNPTDGLALSQYMFSQTFMRIDTYFFPTSGLTLVPDPRYVHRGAWDRTMAAHLAVDGPSEWLSRIIDSSIRDGISVEDSVTLAPGGIADIPLSGKAMTLTPNDATTLAIEIAATMRNVPGVNRIRLFSNGVLLNLAGASEDMSIPVSLANNYDSAGTTSAENLSLIHNDVVASMVDQDPILTPGDWGTTPRVIQSFAVSRLRNEVAAVTPKGLLVGVRGGELPQLLLPGSDLLRPQYDLRGNIWAISNKDLTTTVTMINGDTQIPIDASALDGMAIQGFQLAPDGRRIVMVRQVDLPGEGSRKEIGIALISYVDSQPAAIISWKPLRLTWEGSPIRSIVDMAWMGPSSLLVLGSTGANPAGVYFTDIDGLGMDEWGLPQAWDPREMATHITSSSPQIVVLDRDGTAWFYQEGFRWSHPTIEAVSAITFPV